MQIGVDVVDLARFERHSSGWNAMAARRIGARLRSTAPISLDVAASVAVEEALIKALGGRRPGFHWTDLELIDEPAATGPEWFRPLAATLDHAYRRAPLTLQRCQVHGDRWPSPPGDESWAVWTVADGHVLALAASVDATVP